MFGKANWSEIKHHLICDLNDFKLRCETLCSNEIWKDIKFKLLKLMQDYIPSKAIIIINKRPWMNRALKCLLRKQRILHSRSKSSGLTEDLEKFRSVRSKASALNDKLYNDFIQKSLDDGLNSKSFWRYIKSLRKEPGIPSIRDSSNCLSTDPKIKANIFNSVLKDNYNYDVFEFTDNIVTDKNIIQHEMQAVIICENVVLKLLSDINPKKSAGPDGLPGRVLKCLSNELAPYFSVLFTKIISSGFLPDDWKTANVVPIFKSGSKHCAENYRPISLTCIISRIFERILHSAIFAHLHVNHIIIDNQHGFRKGLSCETQLISLFHDLSMAMDHRDETDIIFLDFKKAFDRVPHCYLLAKLRMLGIDENVLAVIQSFLSDRSQRVIIDGNLSESVPVPSGVPQGSVLGPLLFTVFINDLVINLSSQVRLYADDCTIYRVIKSLDDQVALQKDLDLIMQWCSTWGMELNSKKCEFMTVSRRINKSLRSYHLGGVTLAKVNFIKYLGIIFNDDLSWTGQIDSVVSKANRALGFVRRSLKNSSKATKLKCYFSLVRPHLEYACSAWDPFLSSHMHKLEMVQRRAARFICNTFSRKESVTPLLNELNLSTLAKRREISRCKLFYKIDSQLIPLNMPPELKRKEVNGRTDNGKAYSHIVTRTNPFFSSFFPRTVRDWDSLPAAAVLSPSFCSFSNSLQRSAVILSLDASG